MRCRLTVLCALLFSIALFPLNLQAQTKQDALQILNMLQSRCETGVNIDSYATALSEAEFEMQGFFDSRESQNNPEFTDKLERALIAFQSAYILWKAKLAYKEDFVSSSHPTARLLLNVYPQAAPLFRHNGQAHVPALVAFFWDQGDKRIAEAKRMVGGKSRR